MRFVSGRFDVRQVLSACAVGAVLLAGAGSANAQQGKRAGKHLPPLVIREQGSFFVGGAIKNRAAGDDVTIGQMYVQYQVPVNAKKRPPVVFTHGCCLSSKTWETTPDGRMGWDQYFLRKGYPVYLTDQVGRARSGFDATPFNQVRAGQLAPGAQPSINHASHQFAWSVFRFGPYGQPYSDQQFPMEAVEELYKQMIPDLSSGLPTPNPTWGALGQLADDIGKPILVGHSQSGTFPFEGALRSQKGVAGLISIEPGRCDRFGYTPQQIAALAAVPILVVFGDHLTGIFNDFWKVAYDDCLVFINKVNAAGGNAKMLYPPDLGIYGNSHMLMQDRNSLQIADLILDWIDRDVRRRQDS